MASHAPSTACAPRADACVALQNLFPVQIENVLTAHPAVREAAAVAVPDAKLGEVVGAWVVREPHASLSREDVRSAVAAGMNPQVRPREALPSDRVGRRTV